MILLGWLGIALSAFLLDAAVTGRQPIATLRSVVQTGTIPARPAKPTALSLDNTLNGIPNVPKYSSDSAASGNTTSASQSIDTNPWPTAPSGGSYTGNLAGWIAQATTLLESQGIPAAKLDPSAIQLIIQKESGGNPLAINTTDSNAQAGHPSIGLTQTIRSTFNSNALPGHYDIFNPVDNIAAGMNYAVKRYGSVSNVPGVKSVSEGGSYVGY